MALFWSYFRYIFDTISWNMSQLEPIELGCVSTVGCGYYINIAPTSAPSYPSGHLRFGHLDLNQKVWFFYRFAQKW
jgi:hypothetical protein